MEGVPRTREIDLSVSMTSRPGYLQLAISDSGPGISLEIKHMLFSPLKSSKSGGLGLGLSLCSTIVRAHGGEIWFDEGDSARTRFVFTIPVMNGAAQTA